MMRLRAIAVVAAVGAMTVGSAQPAAAANDFSTTFRGITSSWDDGPDRFRVSGGSSGDYGQLRRPNGNIVQVSTGNSRVLDVAEDRAIAIRSCENRAMLPDECGPWVSGFS